MVYGYKRASLADPPELLDRDRLHIPIVVIADVQRDRAGLLRFRHGHGLPADGIHEFQARIGLHGVPDGLAGHPVLGVDHLADVPGRHADHGVLAVREHLISSFIPHLA